MGYKISKPWSVTVPKIIKASGVVNIEIPPDEPDETPAAPDGFAFVAAELVSVTAYAGTGVSGMSGSVIDPSESYLSFTANAAGRTARLDHRFASRPTLGAGETWVGFMSVPNEISNISTNAFSVGVASNQTFIGFNSGAIYSSGTQIHVVHSVNGAAYPTSIDGAVVLKNPNLGFVDGVNHEGGLICQSAGAGNCQVGWNSFYWIKKLA